MPASQASHFQVPLKVPSGMESSDSAVGVVSWLDVSGNPLSPGSPGLLEVSACAKLEALRLPRSKVT